MSGFEQKAKTTEEISRIDCAMIDGDCDDCEVEVCKRNSKQKWGPFEQVQKLENELTIVNFTLEARMKELEQAKQENQKLDAAYDGAVHQNDLLNLKIVEINKIIGEAPTKREYTGLTDGFHYGRYAEAIDMWLERLRVCLNNKTGDKK
jgi:hypothetical protein